MSEENPKGPRGTLSLTARVALAVAGILAVGGVLVLLAALAYGQQAAREAYDRLLVGAANEIASSILVRDGEALVDVPVSAFELLALAPNDRVAYRVVGAGGETLTGYETAELPTEAGAGPQLYDGEFAGEPVRFASVVRRFAERDYSGAVRVVVGHTLRARDALAFDIAQSALVVLAIAGIGMTVLAFFAVQSALRPLRRIGASLQSRDPHDLTPIDLAVPKEVAIMLTALNGFMTRLDRQVSAIRNLISDSAHQLRTPVAALRAQAELAAGETDPQRQQQIVARIHRRSIGLGRLLDQLLSRALIIHRADTFPRERLDLRTVALRTLEESDHDVLSSGAEVNLDLFEDEVRVSGDPLSLSEACKNLLNNAVVHGQSPITLGVRIRQGEALLFVTDQGAGPPAGTLARVGERHAQPGEKGGAGLGLSIARSVAAAHGGRLDFRNPAAGGFETALVLPLKEGVS